MTQETDEILTIEVYRGVAIHDFQTPERIAEIVRPAIDHVHGLSDIARLYDYALDHANPPEARLYAAAKCQAAHEIAATARIERPDFSLATLGAATAGLNSFFLIDPDRYGTVLAELVGGDRRALRPPEMKEAILAEERRRDAGIRTN